MGDTKSKSSRTHSKLIDAKGVIRFFCLFLLFYGLLIAPWPGLPAAYTKSYRAAAGFLFKSFGSKGVVRFHQQTDDKSKIKILFYRRDRVYPDGQMIPLGSIGHSSRLGGYIPTAFTFALIMATPISWRRRGRALFWGMILIHVFLVSKLAIWVLYGFNHEQISLLVLSPFWKRVLSLTVNVFLRNLTFRLIVSFFIWILVTFRRKDWPRILMQKNARPETISKT